MPCTMRTDIVPFPEQRCRVYHTSAVLGRDVCTIGDRRLIGERVKRSHSCPAMSRMETSNAEDGPCESFSGIDCVCSPLLDAAVPSKPCNVLKNLDAIHGSSSEEPLKHGCDVRVGPIIASTEAWRREPSTHGETCACNLHQTIIWLSCSFSATAPEAAQLLIEL